jgi:hypothetical protein
MTEREAIVAMKHAREEGRATPSKILALMKDWPDLEKLQWEGCCAVWLAASDNASARNDLGSLGAADALVMAMGRFPESKQIAEKAAWAMAALAYDNQANAAHLGMSGNPKSGLPSSA